MPVCEGEAARLLGTACCRLGLVTPPCLVPWQRHPGPSWLSLMPVPAQHQVFEQFGVGGCPSSELHVRAWWAEGKVAGLRPPGPHPERGAGCGVRGGDRLCLAAGGWCPGGRRHLPLVSFSLSSTIWKVSGARARPAFTRSARFFRTLSLGMAFFACARERWFRSFLSALRL